MRKFRTSIRWRDVFFILIIIKLIYWLLRCCKKSNRINPAVKIENFEATVIENQLIILKKDDVSPAEFEVWKTRNLGGRNLQVLKVCGNCDKSLELWEGEDVATFISDKAAQGGIPPVPNDVQQGGEDETVYFTYNLVVNLPEPDDCQPVRTRKEESDVPNTGQEPPLIVAVFDTGLMPPIKNQYTFPVAQSCIPNGKKGWNFVKKSSVTTDDHDGKHGSTVSKFIIDQGGKIQKRRINILPVKVHDDDGQGTLFNILCAFAYAAKCGASIINASFGFYLKKVSAPPSLLVAFAQKYLADNNILLIAAAGNINPEEDNDFFSHLPPGYSQQEARNLDKHPFYPACLSTVFKNVITVTTVHVSDQEAVVCPNQNFSGTFVDIGVNCDIVNGNDFEFVHPLEPGLSPVTGSSYATPIVTGIIAQYYQALSDHMAGQPFDNQLVVEKLKSLGVLKDDVRLNGSIKEGSFCLK